MLIAQTQNEVNITIWTIRLALACMVIVLAIRTWYLRRPTFQMVDQIPGMLEAAKCIWLIGSLLALIHTFAAMGWYHQWSHVLAFEDTASQTEELLGVRVGVGVWFNYCFVAVWTIDALWWVGSPANYERRPRLIHWTVYGFLIFIAINGAVVFESGVVRWLGVAALAILIGMRFLLPRVDVPARN